MKNLRWLAVTAVLFTATLCVTGWSVLKDLGHQREWKAVSVSGAEGELDGIRVGVREARAAVVDNKPDRALLFVRIDLQGLQTNAQSWVDCRASLRSSDGQMWLPIYDYSIRGAIRILASDGKDNGDCNPTEVTESSPTTFDQIYRLPASALDDLTLRVSGYGTRPAALAFPLKPEVRRFKAE
ncbi:hypothetical protein KYK29_16310 [Shinella daejeonensis]|uniref:hypothetical protein n=1 Tax=Shinella daejeonensis TaxID=659017 RepID=UPI0020C77406|nr:hypothetical protein [Shinella daejeonensis]MCP8896490.1 hypothetical protein [Shinella daejeonensis]